MPPTGYRQSRYVDRERSGKDARVTKLGQALPKVGGVHLVLPDDAACL